MKKLPDPVIIVPGITATYLRDEYETNHEILWTAIKKNYSRINLHPNDLRYELIEPSMVKHGQIFSVAYKDIIEELRYNLKETEDEDVPVYPFGYDWRMPLETSSRALDDFISEVIDRTKLLRHYHANGYGTDPKVTLIGHSMGGLVILGYLQSKGKKACVGKVVTLATPYQGSFEAALKIATGNANLGENNSSDSRERETARLTPSLYYLLPEIEDALRVDAGIEPSLFNADSWQKSVGDSIAEFIRLKGLPSDDPKIDARTIFEKFLMDAKSFRERNNNFKLEDAGLDNNKWMAIVGVDSITRVGMKITGKDGFINFDLTSSDRKNEWESESEADRINTGDGTVPFEGAIPAFLKKENVVCVTPEDYGYWEGVDKVLSHLTGFHGILPNMNMLHRLIVRFLKDLPDPRGNTWGRRAPGVKKWNPPLKLWEKKDD